MVEPKQLTLDFEEWRPDVARRRNQEYILNNHVEKYPPSSEEWAIITMGIRLARHVGDWECENCALSTMDHTEGWTWPTLVCLKDVRRLGLATG